MKETEVTNKEAGSAKFAEVNFFRGKAKSGWLATLILSVIISAGLLVCISMVPNKMSRSLLSVALAACVAIVVICFVTMKLRTSKWVIGENGVSYYACGKKVNEISWEEMKSAGFLKKTSHNKGTYYLFWAKNEAQEKEVKEIGKCNTKYADVILYELEPNAPAKDTLLAATKAHCTKELLNPEFLKEAEAAAK